VPLWLLPRHDKLMEKLNFLIEIVEQRLLLVGNKYLL
jgi:hypothetical protein